MPAPPTRGPSLRAVRLGTAVFLLALAAYVLRESFELQYHTNLGPGPGFFPRWLAGGLAACAVGMGVQAILPRRAGRVAGDATAAAPMTADDEAARGGATSADRMPADFLPDRAGALRIGAVVVALVAVVVLLEPLGFRLTMCAAYLGLLVVLGRRDRVLTPAVALAGSFGVYHVFVHWLRVPLPVGVFGI